VAFSPDLETGIGYIYQSSSQKQDDGTTQNKTKNGFNLIAKYKLTKNVFVGLNYLSITNGSQYGLNIGYKF
jgi:opacity protein-like surface antigen